MASAARLEPVPEPTVEAGPGGLDVMLRDMLASPTTRNWAPTPRPTGAAAAPAHGLPAQLNQIASLARVAASGGGAEAAAEDELLVLLQNGAVAAVDRGLAAEGAAARLAAARAGAALCRPLTAAYARQSAGLVAARQRLALAQWWPIRKGDRLVPPPPPHLHTPRVRLA
jgi:hypothetical protein